MKNGIYKLFSILSSLFIMASGVFFYFWLPIARYPDSFFEQIKYLSNHMIFNILYVLFVSIGIALFIPVLIFFSIKHYKDNPNLIIIAGSILIFGLLLEVIANLGSLSQWIAAIPEGLKENKFGIDLYATINIHYISINSFAVLLEYTAITIYGIGFWKEYKSTSVILFLSTGFIIGGIIMTPFSFFYSMILMALSIFIFGFSLLIIGRLAIKK